MSEVKRIDIADFREQGFLQEANRLFFHPLGLALEVTVEDDGIEHLSGIWDYRDDPEGILYGDGEVDVGKVSSVAAEAERHRVPREAILGEGQTVQGAQPRHPSPMQRGI
jgi:hypothetical protein